MKLKRQDPDPILTAFLCVQIEDILRRADKHKNGEIEYVHFLGEDFSHFLHLQLNRDGHATLNRDWHATLNRDGHATLNRDGHATTLPRQRDRAFRPQNCWLLHYVHIRRGNSI